MILQLGPLPLVKKSVGFSNVILPQCYLDSTYLSERKGKKKLISSFAAFHVIPFL